MSEAAIIPKIPPIKEPESKPEVVSSPVLPQTDSSPVQSEIVENQSLATKNSPLIADDPSPLDSGAVTSTSTVHVPDEAESFGGSDSSTITYFQGVIYASFILTFCLAGFAAVVVFRKSLKTSVKRFSIGAKVLALAYFVLAFFGSFGTYVYSRFLNGGETFFSLAIPMLSWILVGPAVATVLNSLLTRDDKPEAKKIIFDAFTYLIIFSLVVASQIPFFEAREPLIFSVLGVVFLLFPIIRFFGSIKASKIAHPELQEVFVQILVLSLIFLPILLPSLALTNVFGLIDDGVALLLFNLVTFAFILMTGLLVVISIDYITQGISADQLVAQNPGDPKTPPTEPTQPVSPVIPKIQTVQKTTESIPEKKVEEVKPSSVSSSTSPPPVSKSSNPSAKVAIPSEESLEADEFDVDKDDSTVIKFNVAEHSDEESGEDVPKSKETKFRLSGSKPKPVSPPKKPKLPKAPQPPSASKSTDSKAHAKPPEKPKKRF